MKRGERKREETMDERGGRMNTGEQREGKVRRMNGR